MNGGIVWPPDFHSSSRVDRPAKEWTSKCTSLPQVAPCCEAYGMHSYGIAPLELPAHPATRADSAVVEHTALRYVPPCREVDLFLCFINFTRRKIFYLDRTVIILWDYFFTVYHRKISYHIHTWYLVNKYLGICMLFFNWYDTNTIPYDTNTIPYHTKKIWYGIILYCVPGTLVLNYQVPGIWYYLVSNYMILYDILHENRFRYRFLPLQLLRAVATTVLLLYDICSIWLTSRLSVPYTRYVIAPLDINGNILIDICFFVLPSIFRWIAGVWY